MRFHNSNTYVPDGDLRVRMNPGNGEPFAVIDLGPSELWLDSHEDAQRLFEAAARIVGYYQMLGQPHAYVRQERTTHCGACGMLPRHADHTEAEPEPGPYDRAIQQAKFFAQPGNTIDDVLAAAHASEVTA